MSQFRSFQLTQQVYEAELTEVKPEYNPVTPSTTQTTPLILFTRQPASTTEPLADISGSQATTSTTDRILRIPGSRERSRITEQLPRCGPIMSTRLRQTIVLISALLVVIMTLLSLAPVDNGRSVTYPLFRGITDWVHAQQANWQFQ